MAGGREEEEEEGVMEGRMGREGRGRKTHLFMSVGETRNTGEPLFNVQIVGELPKQPTMNHEAPFRV